jgi:hypothetical protein
LKICSAHTGERKIGQWNATHALDQAQMLHLMNVTLQAEVCQAP